MQTPAALPSSFRRLAWANLAAQSAEQLSLAAVPMVAVLSLGAGAAETGLLAAAQTLPFLLLSIPAGLLADRTSRRRLLVRAEAVRCAALLALVWLAFSAHLSIPLLAALGFVGADTILDGVRGFGAAFANGLDAERLLADLGESIPVTVEYKPYSAARPIHNGIDCALNIRRAHALDPQQIERIVIHRHPAWANYHTNTSPSTYHEAQVSLPFSVALAFVEGRAFPDQYADERLGRSELTNVAHRVEIRTQEDLPRGVSCRMVVTMQDGTEFEEQVDYPKGSTGNPMDDAELEQKFRHLAEPVLGADRLDRAVAAIWSIDQSPDVSELLDALS
ncbi:MAG: MFS transporter, partial [Caldimonas sp.]